MRYFCWRFVLLLLGFAILFGHDVACVCNGLVFVVLRTGWVDLMLLPMIEAIFAASRVFSLALALFGSFYQRRHVDSRYTLVR